MVNMVDLGEKSVGPSVETHSPTTIVHDRKTQGEDNDKAREHREPTSETNDTGNETDDDEDDEDTKDELPLSKARCIALVATVTGASFLNVRGESSIVNSNQL